jgi:glycosyltransferase involved in cell wall biosynthesis
MKLSVLIPGVPSRMDPPVLRHLLRQREKLANPEDVEIIYLLDTKSMSVGAKRNRLVQMAGGTYITFVDDDDRVTDDYLSSLVDATSQNTDVIVFPVKVSLDGARPKPCYYSITYPKDQNYVWGYERLPNHIMCVKRSIATKVGFPEINRGEDSLYAKRLKPFLETEYNIGKVLYFYDYNSRTTETQR